MVRFSKKSTSFSLFLMAMGMVFMIAGPTFPQRIMEKLSRGLVAVKSGTGYFLSWRLFGPEYGTDIAFNAYKGTTKLNTSPITDATCYQDNSTGTGDYSVKAVVGGQELAASAAEYVLSNNYLSIPLQNSSGYKAGDCSCGDLNGDGQYEIVVKEENSPQDNANAGTTGQTKLTAYTLAGKQMWKIDLGINIREGAHYTQFLVYDFDSDGSAEVACKTAPGTKDATGGFLKTGPAAGADNAADYRNSSGYILTGPEWYTVFSGKTGAELATLAYNPPRGTVSSWGDDYGNRVDRFLACVGYFDGTRPSACPCRGYYTRMCCWAVDWRGGKLTQRWFFDSDVSANSKAAGQGNHQISVGDVDADGKDEVVEGACTIDDNGTLLGATGVGHGDASHLSDLDPDRPGLEFFSCHEGAKCVDMRDPANSTVIWTGPKASADVGRCGAGDVTAASKGVECWGNGYFTCKGATASGSAPGVKNFSIWWDGDLLRELLNGTSITKYGGGNLLSASGCTSCNGTKSTPCLSADIFGDWREEVMFSCGSELRIYTTTTPTTNRLYTLMHDPQYRLSIAWQNVAYNQPPWTGFYLGDQMAAAPKPKIQYPDGSVDVNPISPRDYSQKVASKGSMKVWSDRSFEIPNALPGSLNKLSIYNCSGRLLRKSTVRKTSVNLQSEFGIPKGIYMVKLNETR